MYTDWYYSGMNNQAYMDAEPIKNIALFWSIDHYHSGEAAKQKAYKK
jgi:hypothetical protein